MTAPVATAPGPVAAATALLAAALLLLDHGCGRGRLRALTAVPPPADPAPEPVLRRSWAAVAAVAAASLGWLVAGAGGGIVSGALAAVLGALAVRRAGAATGPPQAGSAELAGTWQLVAVSLAAGLPVAVAVSAAAGSLGGLAGTELRRVAGLLELGADPADAWDAAAQVPALRTFARAAGRSAGTGSALAQVARAEAVRVRTELEDAARARAQRAAVLITGPLGLCFLPAFLLLGIAPVVIGLAGEALAQW